MNVQSAHSHPQDALCRARAHMRASIFTKSSRIASKSVLFRVKVWLKKRLLDSKIGIELDFEELVLAVREYGAGVVEG